MAKKTTKKKAPKKPVAKKKAGKAAPKKKVAKKSAKKAPVRKKAPVKKASPAKKSVKKTPVKKKAAKASKKAAPEKTVTKGKAKGSNPSDNGKSTKKNKKKVVAPPKIHRVIRPTPPPTEPVIEDWTPLSDAKLRKVKTGLTRKEMGGFKKLLMEKRAQLVGDVLNMEEVRNAGNGGELSNMPLHMADVGSDNYEQEFTLGLAESERKLLTEIDAALLRIQSKTYGVCLITGTPIPKARLEIKPWAKYSIEIVRKREKQGMHSF